VDEKFVLIDSVTCWAVLCQQAFRPGDRIGRVGTLLFHAGLGEWLATAQRKKQPSASIRKESLPRIGEG
jgi:hypothetical protein